MTPSKPRIVVAENDPEYRRTLLDFLDSEGYVGVEAVNGADALEKIRNGKRPDLILLDLDMPVLSGAEFLAVRESDPALLMIPVIVISGAGERPAEIGSGSFLAKPVSPDKLRRVIAETLDEADPDPARRPRPTEPWSIDDRRAQILRNRFGRAVAFIASEREARRVAAAVNGSSRLSTEALEQGIIDKGLECLYQLHRYDTDDAYRREIDGTTGRASLLSRIEEIARMLHVTSRTH